MMQALMTPNRQGNEHRRMNSHLKDNFVVSYLFQIVQFYVIHTMITYPLLKFSHYPQNTEDNRNSKMAGLGQQGVDLLLTTVGFDDDDRDTIRLEVFPDVQSMRNFTQSDIKDTARDYARKRSKRTHSHLACPN